MGSLSPFWLKGPALLTFEAGSNAHACLHIHALTPAGIGTTQSLSPAGSQASPLKVLQRPAALQVRGQNLPIKVSLLFSLSPFCSWRFSCAPVRIPPGIATPVIWTRACLTLGGTGPFGSVPNFGVSRLVWGQIAGGGEDK